VAAIIGSAFIIAIQVLAITSIGTMSQSTFFQSDFALEHAPPAESWVWIPARAILGDTVALIIVLALGAALLIVPMMLLSARLGEYALAAATADGAPGTKGNVGPTAIFLGRFRARPVPAHCSGAKNGFCCCAIPGSPRRA